MPDPPPPPPGIDEKIAKAVANEDYELAARLKKMKDAPPPPPKKGSRPPPPPKKGRTPPKPGKRKAVKKPGAPPKKGPRPPKPGKRKAVKKPGGPPKRLSRPKGPPKPKPKRRRRLRLKMRSKTIAEEEDSYSDRVGWNVSVGTVLEEVKETVEEPQTITHQCTMCGSMMTIPKPKRDRYRIVCSHPQCGHSDTVGI